jgi:hypothetical protein
LPGICDFPRHLIDGRWAWEAGHDNSRIARNLTGVAGDYDVGLYEFGSARRVDIIADNAPAAVDEIAGNRTSHDAKSDDSNSLVHASSFPTC